MAHWIVLGGEVKRTKAVDRGEPLLHTSHEWFDIYRRWLSAESAESTLLVIIGLLILLLLYTKLDAGLAMYGIASLPAVAAALFFLPRWMATRSFTRHGLAPGLYRHGLQVPALGGRSVLFFPYAEMSYVRCNPERRSGFVKIGILQGEGWVDVDREFLGEDALALLRSLAGHEPSPATVDEPRLVVYPPLDR